MTAVINRVKNDGQINRSYFLELAFSQKGQLSVSIDSGTVPDE
jgi:hypothetical protein